LVTNGTARRSVGSQRFEEPLITKMKLAGIVGSSLLSEMADDEVSYGSLEPRRRQQGTSVLELESGTKARDQP
jgi:hypothetical protein